MDITLDELSGKTPGEGESGPGPGGDDFLGKVNSIVTGINLLFDNWQRMQKNIGAQSGADQGKAATGLVAPADQGATLKIVDQRLLYLVTQTFANKALNMPLNRLIAEYGEMSIVQAMEKAGKDTETATE